jgi:hypothetical protein
MNGILGTALRKRHRYTWIVFGSFFLLFAYNFTGRNGVLNLGPLIFLLVLYFASGQGAATLIGTLTERSGYDPAFALSSSTIKVAFIASIGSFLVHLCLIWFAGHFAGVWLPDFRSTKAVLIGSPIFTFMACLSASGTLARR